MDFNFVNPFLLNQLENVVLECNEHRKRTATCIARLYVSFVFPYKYDWGFAPLLPRFFMTVKSRKFKEKTK